MRVVKKSRWHARPDWDGWEEGDIQGDALLDLRTQDNALSVFRVDESAGIGRIIAALAATRENLSHLDYVVFDDAPLEPIGVNMVQRDGKTPDNEVNDIHYDVVNLTVLKLVQLAQTVSQCRPERVPKIEVKAKLRQSLESRWLDTEKVDDGLLSQLSLNRTSG